MTESKMPVDEMILARFDKMTVDKMTVDEISLGKMTVHDMIL
jgi:hypothetical protein